MVFFSQLLNESFKNYSKCVLRINQSRLHFSTFDSNSTFNGCSFGKGIYDKLLIPA